MRTWHDGPGNACVPHTILVVFIVDELADHCASRHARELVERREAKQSQEKRGGRRWRTLSIVNLDYRAMRYPIVELYFDLLPAKKTGQK